MRVIRWAAITFAVVSGGVVGFQLALAAGAPWGEYAMGGAFPGQFPPMLRVAAVGQAILLLLFAGIVLAQAGIALSRWTNPARRLIWVVVAFSTLSLILNLITPSAGERAIWAPVAAVLFIGSLLVALKRQV